jgi:hypothetical protein
MKMKTWLITLPLLGMTGVAMAQGAGPAETEPAQAREQVQENVQEQTRDRKATPKAKQRQGADMRHCLDLKDDKAISRCAEPGRKP